MFWIEQTDDGKCVTLFSHVSLGPHADELAELGGMYLESAACRRTGRAQEGWIFAAAGKDAVEAFIAREEEDVRSAAEDDLSLEDIYDLLLEAFDRIAALEAKLTS